ncbi:AAA family ATPase [Psychromicrobium lacuslunae]|uniref:Nucleoside kinase n=1 Tax=Psychromicrobium lacuslunae TaxID=1618207 RepID=A0A0D4BVQ7_9MICC|nr:AAA family ATPase [Psychromicrobium lacuslunae]AJT40502.1 nucleoside kinase [Psychromicrobium lacuslunae]
MGVRNYLLEGVSGTGKTSVGRELERRGYQVVHGDRELAYQGDPFSGERREGVTGVAVHEHHLWCVEKVRALVVDHSHSVTFFCGGSRNFPEFIDLFDGVFVLTVDRSTLMRRLDQRDETEWGGRGRWEERELIERLHRTEVDLPAAGVRIDASLALSRVVDEILLATSSSC